MNHSYPAKIFSLYQILINNIKYTFVYLKHISKLLKIRWFVFGLRPLWPLPDGPFYIAVASSSSFTTFLYWIVFFLFNFISSKGFLLFIHNFGVKTSVKKGMNCISIGKWVNFAGLSFHQFVSSTERSLNLDFRFGDLATLFGPKRHLWQSLSISYQNVKPKKPLSKWVSEYAVMQTFLHLYLLVLRG